MADITLETPDSIEYVPYLSVVGTKWTRTSDQQTYMIMGYVYNLNTNLWMLMIQNPGTNFQCCVSPSDFANEFERVQ